MMALDETQYSTSSVWFVTKHAILTTVIGVHIVFNARCYKMPWHPS